MATVLRINVEEYDLDSGAIINTSQVKELTLEAPNSIEEIGFTHREQIDLLQDIQDILVQKQCILIDVETICPLCGSKTMKCGTIISQFHSVLTDHTVKIQRRICKCGWQNNSTIHSRFGTSSHPDLLKLQCEEGAQKSYRKAERYLNRRCCGKRKVNNETHIKRAIFKAGEILTKIRSKASEISTDNIANEIIVQVDGGHIKSKGKHKRSIEALAGKVYRPENLVRNEQGRATITDKTCVALALDDDLKTMQEQILYAAKKQGMDKNTHVTVICDGANNCWGAVSILDKYCSKITKILDWFHIGKNFKNVQQKIPKEYHDILERAKWNIWHNQTEKCLEKLSTIKEKLEEKEVRKCLDDLYQYIFNNKKFIINYGDRYRSELTYTSTVIESEINNIINERQKKKQKMQWTRFGAHYILQIRTSIINKLWDQDWNTIFPLMIEII